MLKRAKTGVLRLAEVMGATQLLSASTWRRRRLLILCYHGVSKYDEHEWSDLYISPETFRHRLELLVRFRCNVLSLGSGDSSSERNSA